MSKHRARQEPSVQHSEWTTRIRPSCSGPARGTRISHPKTTHRPGIDSWCHCRAASTSSWYWRRRFCKRKMMESCLLPRTSICEGSAPLKFNNYEEAWVTHLYWSSYRSSPSAFELLGGAHDKLESVWNNGVPGSSGLSSKVWTTIPEGGHVKISWPPWPCVDLS